MLFSCLYESSLPTIHYVYVAYSWHLHSNSSSTSLFLPSCHLLINGCTTGYVLWILFYEFDYEDAPILSWLLIKDTKWIMIQMFCTILSLGKHPQKCCEITFFVVSQLTGNKTYLILSYLILSYSAITRPKCTMGKNKQAYKTYNQVPDTWCASWE